VTNPKTYFNCRETGHFIANCPYKKTTLSVFSNSVNRPKQMTRITCGAPTKTQPSFGRAKVNHVYAKEAEDAPGVVLGEFLVQSLLATILFDSGASHSFTSSYFIETQDIPTAALKRPLITKSPGGHIPYHLGVINIPINLSGGSISHQSSGIKLPQDRCYPWNGLANQIPREHRLCGKNHHRHKPPRKDRHLAHRTKFT
jgi:hypothetical protein